MTLPEARVEAGVAAGCGFWDAPAGAGGAGAPDGLSGGLGRSWRVLGSRVSGSPQDPAHLGEKGVRSGLTFDAWLASALM